MTRSVLTATCSVLRALPRAGIVAAVGLCLSVPVALAERSTPPSRPPIVWKPIPYGPKRLAEMAAYARRHYRISGWILHPRVVVEHYTASSTFASAYSAFAPDQPDPELHEIPGVCAHFIIDRDGTIYQLVRLNVMCRHTVGLNYVAIGIEHVSESDQQILSDPRQLKASLALTLWLMDRFHIPLGDVIGHNESLTSPYHKEFNPAWRCQTHGDWRYADMQAYRADLAALARRHNVPLGPKVPPRDSNC